MAIKNIHVDLHNIIILVYTIILEDYLKLHISKQGVFDPFQGNSYKFMAVVEREYLIGTPFTVYQKFDSSLGIML